MQVAGSSPAGSSKGCITYRQAKPTSTVCGCLTARGISASDGHPKGNLNCRTLPVVGNDIPAQDRSPNSENEASISVAREKSFRANVLAIGVIGNTWGFGPHIPGSSPGSLAN